MNLSTSSSDQQSRVWRRMFLSLLAGFAGLAGFAYLFIAVVDPWDTLPLSPNLPRVPISTNARFSFPALARSPHFDSAIFGTSTSRLLRPVVLNPLFHARFANLAMNSATAWEQTKLLMVFARAHPNANTVMIGLDIPWCETGSDYQTLTGREFPDWMYGRDPWRGYGQIANLFALQEAANQFAVLMHWKKRRYGLDGYTNFTPPESEYDAARAHAHILAEGVPDELGGNATEPLSAVTFPAHALLRQALTALPAQTRKILFFVPYARSYQGLPGSVAARMWGECKRRVMTVAAETPNTVVADFMIPSPITNDETHYWDPKHYRTPVADQLAHDLWLAAQARSTANDQISPP